MKKMLQISLLCLQGYVEGGTEIKS